jgi:hypothetical protein
MGYKIERLTAKDYDELLCLLNTVFHKEEGNTFDVFLPVMWERTDEQTKLYLQCVFPLPLWWCNQDRV